MDGETPEGTLKGTLGADDGAAGVEEGEEGEAAMKMAAWTSLEG